jgi:4-amino-4-deoxy-L-arabinose transferase-like glycosyltransferase
VALGSGIGRTDFVPPDEARVSEISREMTLASSWELPVLNGEPFLEEPPLFYWMQAIVFRVAGDASTALARVPAVAGAVAGAIATAGLARGLGADPLLATVVLATAPEFWWMARNATPDTTAAAATTVALTLFFLAWRSGSRMYAAASVLALGLAFWSKSFLPVGLAGVAAGTFLLWSGRGRLSWWTLGLMVAGVAATALLWIGVMAHALGHEAVEFFVVKNHLGRLAGGPAQGHVRPFYYYLPNLLLGLFPWSLALPAAALAAWRERSMPERRFAFVWALSMTVLLSASATKRAHYILAAYPGFAVLAAGWLPQALEGRLDRMSRRLMVLATVVVPPVLALLLLGMDISQLMGVPDNERAGVLWRGLLASLAHRPSVWGGAAALATIGLALVLAERTGRWMVTAAVIAVQLIATHLLLSLVILPRFDPYTSARAWGTRLGRIQAGGTPVVAFGFRSSEALTPFMFYARQRFLAFDDVAALAARVQAVPACVFVQTKDQARLAAALPGRVADRGKVGDMDILLVEARPGLCQ